MCTDDFDIFSIASKASGNVVLLTVAFLRGGEGATAPLWELCSLLPLRPPMNLCKAARLHDSCIHSMASHSWCQITPLTQLCITLPRWPPPTAATRNALVTPKVINHTTALHSSPYFHRPNVARLDPLIITKMRNVTWRNDRRVESRIYRVDQIKWHHFTFLLVTHECIHKILWFLAHINYIMRKMRRC